MLPDFLWSTMPEIADFIMAICCVIDGLMQGLVRGFAPMEQVDPLLHLLDSWWQVFFC